MLKAITWCAKCLFLYFLVAVAAVRFSWVFTTPAWQLADKMHWTQLNRVSFVLSYFLPIFAATGFLVGLIPFGKLGKALGDLFRSFFPSASTKLAPEPDRQPDIAPPILWAWLPVTLAFLTRFVTWQSRNSSVLDHTDRPAASNASSARSTRKHPACSTTSGLRIASSSLVPCSSSWPAPSAFCFATALPPHAKHQSRREPAARRFDLHPYT